jgi:predicted MFS family arabinose efflux permease
MEMELTEEKVTHAAGRRAAHRLTPREWMLLLVLSAVQFTHVVDFMIISPLSATYMREMKLTTGEFSLVVAAYMVAAGLASLLASRVMDRFGRKQALLTLYSGFIAGTFLCALAGNYALLLVSRTVAGAFGGVAASVVLAVVGDAFPDARRGAATGVIMSAFSVASILGLPLGLKLEEWYGWHAPFFAIAGLGVVVLILAVALLPPLRGHLGGRLKQSVRWRDFLTNGNYLRAFALMIAIMFGSIGIFPFMASYLEFNVGYPHAHLQYVYLCGGLATLLTLTPIGRLADEYGKLRVFRVCAVATIILIAVVTNLPAGLSTVAVLLATTGLFVATSSRMVPAMAMITASAAPRDRGGFMSMNAAVQHLGAGAATVVSGFLVTGGEGHPLKRFWLVGLLCCASTALCLYLAGRLRTAPGGTQAPDAAEVDAMIH